MIGSCVCMSECVHVCVFVYIQLADDTRLKHIHRGLSKRLQCKCLIKFKYTLVAEQ